DIQSLKTFKIDQNLILGANVSLEDCIGIFKDMAQKSEFDYLNEFIGSLAGNLMLKHANPAYQSDVFLLFESVRAAIMPRNQNALAIVNAAFNFELSCSSQIIEDARIVFGNISSTFVHATKTELFLIGKCVYDNTVLQEAVEVLRGELVPVNSPPEPTVFERPLSKGSQDFQTDTSLYPLNQPVQKLEAQIQSSGEAQYANDVPPSRHDVFGSFVLSTVSSGEVDSIDAKQVLAIEGILAIYTASDIPGKNSFTFPGIQLQTENEEILATKIKFYGQPIAILVAISEELASSVYEIEAQYHYYLEPLTCVVVPVDQGLEVYDSTQWIDLTQIAVSQCLNMKESDVLVRVRRVGGGFGGKISRNVQVATAAAIVARKMDRTCRFILPIQTNLTVAGRRLPTQCDYEAGLDANGKIQYLNATITQDVGCSNNENILSYVAGGFPNCYNTEYFIRLTNMRTDDNDLPSLIATLKEDSHYDKRAKDIELFNKANRWKKKAIKINVMSFPVEFFGNYSALVTIYRGDGTVTITTGGIEMGQGANTKAAQVCAYELGIPLDYVSVIPHYSFTAANNVFSGSSITIYNKTTGKLLTNRSLTYHVPLARDIPVEFNRFHTTRSPY
ncbi:Aldehyde oxidase AOX3, partial [Operophtera brumata]